MLRLRIGGSMCNYIVFSLKYRGKVLVGDRALAAGAVIRRICEEMDIEVIGMVVNPDPVALFIKCLPKYTGDYQMED
jgi:REP element-mobilizing transposase RayT